MNKANKLPKWGGTVGEGRYDHAKIMLKRPVTGAQPLARDPNASSLVKDTPVYMFASQHDDFTSSGNRPVISSCVADETTSLDEGVFRLKTDCDAGGGASGGAVIAKRVGKVVVEGMNIAAFDEYGATNTPFNRESNYQVVLSVSGEALK